ncbi:putative copper-transporting ATPase HMA5 [Prunus yedoensis var. nudiflora]|uniref:Putative copper-transporting ATPase HMA5 n=1 Tax=Prunus yedoensis var. nudiflora TaxID=2094558 RepID=A0A314XKH2_PRUYE|nr:putative copper-transporting ATPase HMA5 [Prunus yedoensis var. nudiflora]
MAAGKLAAIGCFCNDRWGDMSPQPHYPSMPKYPKGTSPEAAKNLKGSEVKALFSVVGMTCSACAGSIEKAVKRLPGIREAAVDVLNNTAHVLYYPSFVTVSLEIPFQLLAKMFSYQHVRV